MDHAKNSEHKDPDGPAFRTGADEPIGSHLLAGLSSELRAAINEEIDRQVATRIKREVAHYRELFELAQQGGRVGVFEINMLDGTSMGSAMWAELLGQPAGTTGIDRRRWVELLHPDDRNRILQAVAEAVATGDDTALEYRIILPDGGIRWLHSRNMSRKLRNGTLYKAYGTLQDITDRKRLEAEILHNAYHDSLTGIPNRRCFVEGLRDAFDKRMRTGQEVAVALFDLDDLKPANDCFGHEAGDALICAAADRLRSVVYDTGMVARLGGDEFAVLLEGSGTQQLQQLADQSLKEISQPVDFNGRLLKSSASAGGAIGSIARSETPEGLLRCADMALYAAKRSGRGTYQVAS